jgi:hypothetical protein
MELQTNFYKELTEDLGIPKDSAQQIMIKAGNVALDMALNFADWIGRNGYKYNKYDTTGTPWKKRSASYSTQYVYELFIKEKMQQPKK